MITEGFQSLFLWIFRSYKLVKDNMLLSAVYVSILVLMDLPFLQVDSSQARKFDKQVSILVLMDLPFLQYLMTMTFLFTMKVSILVLMDLPFLHVEITINDIFIPYEFQSLFLWIFRSYILFF